MLENECNPVSFSQTSPKSNNIFVNINQTYDLWLMTLTEYLAIIIVFSNETSSFSKVLSHYGWQSEKTDSQEVGTASFSLASPPLHQIHINELCSYSNCMLSSNI